VAPQGQQTEGEQTEGEQTEEERRTSEAEPVEVELEFDVETQPTVTVRVSGTEGVQYFGSYGNSRGRRQLVEARTLEAEPVDYPVEIQPGSDEVSATFQKRSPGTGTLRVQILSDAQVQESRETTSEFGAVTATWTP